MRALPVAILCGLVSVPGLAGDREALPWQTVIGGGQSFRSGSDLDVYRAAWRLDFGRPMALGDDWTLGLRGEASLSGWVAHVSAAANQSGGGDETLVGAVAPVLRLAASNGSSRVRPFVEAGIGLAWLQHKDLAAEDDHEGELGSHLTFEDRLAFGLEFPRIRGLQFGFVLLHYSNANLGDSNDTENIRMLTLSLPL